TDSPRVKGLGGLTTPPKPAQKKIFREKYFKRAWRSLSLFSARQEFSVIFWNPSPSPQTF
ncbi:hypothetical protein D6827_00030, partial [Candidatus Parcubacteria bacterium]